MCSVPYVLLIMPVYYIHMPVCTIYYYMCIVNHACFTLYYICLYREGNEWTLEAGALVLANEGIVCMLLISSIYEYSVNIRYIHTTLHYSLTFV